MGFSIAPKQLWRNCAPRSFSCCWKNYCRFFWYNNLILLSAAFRNPCPDYSAVSHVGKNTASEHGKAKAGKTGHSDKKGLVPAVHSGLCEGNCEWFQVSRNLHAIHLHSLKNGLFCRCKTPTSSVLCYTICFKEKKHWNLWFYFH